MTTRQEWDPLVGSQLALQAPDGRALPAVLTACSPTLDRGNYRCFELTITTTADVGAEQGTYLVTGGRIERRPVFLVPTRLTDGALELTATFSHLVEEDAP